MEHRSDLTGHLERIAARRQSLAGELGTILGPHSRFVWEIGAGHGHFLTSFAQAHPEKLCLGVDLRLERVERAERKRERAALTNLHFLRGDAELFLEALPLGATIEMIFMLFPDPWPKLRHHKHRLLKPSFLTALASRCMPGAPIYFRTDFEPYFAEVKSLLSEDPHWRLEPDDTVWPWTESTVFQQRAPTFHSLVACRRGGVEASGRPD